MARKPIALTIICATVTLAAAAPAGATFPGRNGRIAYATEDGIATVRPNGTDVSPLVDFPGARDPAWSADGGKLAFAAPGGGGHLVIYVVSADGKHLRRVSNAGVDRWRPSWAPDGKRLAVLGTLPPVDGRNRASVNVLKVANRHERQVATAGADPGFGDAEWSPDGAAIAYTDTDIFLVSPNGGAPVQITDEPDDFEEERPDGTVVTHYGHSVAQLSWAPHGNRLAFADLVGCPCDDPFSLAVIRRDGSDRHDIPAGQTERNPVWAPNARAIDFCGYQPYVTESSLWTMRPDGSGQHEVLTGAGCGGDWQALPPKRRG
jgi:Tol biopolymer transport system component